MNQMYMQGERKGTHHSPRRGGSGNFGEGAGEKTAGTSGDLDKFKQTKSKGQEFMLVDRMTGEKATSPEKRNSAEKPKRDRHNRPRFPG